MSRKFIYLNVRSCFGAKTEDMLPYIVISLEKRPEYVDTNDPMDYEASDVIKTTLQVKQFIELKVPHCKAIISRPIKDMLTKRHCM